MFILTNLIFSFIFICFFAQNTRQNLTKNKKCSNLNSRFVVVFLCLELVGVFLVVLLDLTSQIKRLTASGKSVFYFFFNYFFWEMWNVVDLLLLFFLLGRNEELREKNLKIFVKLLSKIPKNNLYQFTLKKMKPLRSTP